MMWTLACDREEAVRRMVREAREDPDLLAHAGVCRDCRETLDAAGWMRELAARPVPGLESRAPSASHLWWKAELLRRWDAERRAIEPVDIGEGIGAGIGVVGAMAILVWLWRQTGSLAWPSIFAGEDLRALPWLIAGMLIFCVVVLGATAMTVLDAGGRNKKG